MLAKRIVYAIICVLFIAYLLFSNTIIAAINNNNVKKLDEDISKYVKNKVLFGIDGFNFNGDVFDSFNINGWAFCETASDNSNKEVWIILDNDHNTYVKKAELIKRIDVAGKFKSNFNIKNVYHGVYSTVSTVGVKSGIYKVYLYCKENDEDYGLADTGIMIKKDSTGISKHIWNSSLLLDIFETDTNVNVKCSFDSVTLIDNNNLEISGWALVEGIDTSDQIVYVRIKDKDGNTATYNTQKISRPDVATYFNNILYYDSGYKAIIPISELHTNSITIEILVGYGENVYLSSETYSISLVLPRESAEISYSEEITIYPENIISDDSVQCAIDVCSIDKSLTVMGWAFVKGADSSATEVYLGVTSADGNTRYFTTYKVIRPDVAKVFNNEIYRESGFSAEIPLDAISVGDNLIAIIVNDGSLRKAETQYYFNYNENK